MLRARLEEEAFRPEVGERQGRGEVGDEGCVHLRQGRGVGPHAEDVAFLRRLRVGEEEDVVAVWAWLEKWAVHVNMSCLDLRAPVVRWMQW